ncbi:bifunctional germination protease/germinant receptor pseudoprotease CspBA [Romboutsia sp.]|uniref:bifunctional germination protease/germinant receptor pseudoprotease CspBA n=1 Tax=Romboutsia sp. TaxID=1965302 RepID=UPI002CAF393D|nr:bifunctional germination protease/germinant receptor pseudoprotease CspBA [Romboutsia sp.]HSQ90281.1 bifunctional germination protease/germinant receptor pseudoprotease CspBA [Romboutsia sp.]
MIIIEYEVIVKYNSNVKRLEEELDVIVEILSSSYAIVISQSEIDIERLIEFPEIEYIEKPFILETQDSQSFSSTGIDSFKRRYKLTGEDTLLGVIDSGIDHTLPIFKDENGESKILYYWDQTGAGVSPEGFSKGTVYTKDNIDEAPIYPTSLHGTHVTGICASIANKANIIAVKVGRTVTDTFSRSTDFMRAIRFVLDRAVELKMPVAINISYGTNEGSHRGLSLFEEFIDDMSIIWKNNIVVAAGNNVLKGGHKRIKLTNEEVEEAEFGVGENEKILNINIWPSYADTFSIYLKDPANRRTQAISPDSPNINNRLGTTRVVGVYFPVAPYSLATRITIQLSSNTQITPGIWTLVFTPIEIVDGNIDMYLPTVEGLSKDTKFLEPTEILTVTVPGTATKVITVGSYNSRTDIRSPFSGEGDFENGVFKPDLLAPGEDIISFLPGGTLGALTGTSMATPHVTGVCSLLMEWGIVKNNDPFLYSQRTRALLNKNARRREDIDYPNSQYGYGFLDLNNIDLDSLVRNKKKVKKNLTRVIDLDTVIKKDLANAILISHNEDFLEELKTLNIIYEIIKLSTDRTLMFFQILSRENVEAILSLESVAIIENVVRVAPLGIITRGTEGGVVPQDEIGVSFFKYNPNIQLTGQGTVIAIIDTGIDYLHEDFIYPDGTSKILYLWDQTKEGNPPEGYFIGTEYTQEDINKAIQEKDDTLSNDEEGHGTMISGICAGLGNINKAYEGVAPGAELIVVKLAKVNGYYNSAMLYTAIQYVYQKSDKLDLTTVVNISMGSTGLVGYADRVNSRETYFSNGICTVAAAGNEGNTEIHTSGIIEREGESVELEIQVEEEEEVLRIEIWLSQHDRAKILLITPSGETSKYVELSNYDLVGGIFDLEQTLYSIRYSYPSSYSGQEHTIIYLRNVKRGIWKIRLEGASISKGRYNAYLENKVFLNKGTKFRESIPDYTINYPSVKQDLITIGTYDSINRSVWASSSRGPSIIQRIKPDVIAPGVNIIAPYPNNKYATITGSAPAAAHASGIVALYYEYIIVKDTYPNKGFIQMIRTFMQGGATRLGDIIYPNNITGYGIINLKGMFEQLK